MIEKSAFRNLSYGLYIITSMKESRPVGCVINTFAQITSNPPQVSVAINKENYTTQGILETNKFEVTVVNKQATMDLIGTFGFHSSKDTNKFADFNTNKSSQGIPYVTDHACAHFSVAVSQKLDLGTHFLFIGEVIEAESIGDIEPMTYAYYHQVKGGRTPKKASSFSTDELEAEEKKASATAKNTKDAKAAEDAKEDMSTKDAKDNLTSANIKKTRIAWRCTICGHIEYVDELPEDFVCPLCGVTRDLFEKIEVEVDE